METLKMSRKERRRLTVLAKVKEGELTLVGAAQALGLSYRQAKRIWKRYGTEGDAGLVHRSRGKTGSRRIEEEQREKILEFFQTEFRDFGPTLATEYLARKNLRVDHETLRRWLIEKQLWVVKRRRQKHRQWRERRACLGEMVQIDGSHHDWFEGRRERAVLMVMIDDATGRVWARFSEEETTAACYDLFEQWVRRWGVPLSLYADRDSIYQCDRAPTVAEQLARIEPKTQFGRAMERLGVTLIPAYSPQAKGRVERCHGTLQDRLVKALRLGAISDLEAANEFLEREFLPEFNRRSAGATRGPASQKAERSGGDPRVGKRPHRAQRLDSELAEPVLSARSGARKPQPCRPRDHRALVAIRRDSTALQESETALARTHRPPGTRSPAAQAHRTHPTDRAGTKPSLAQR